MMISIILDKMLEITISEGSLLIKSARLLLISLAWFLVPDGFKLVVVRVIFAMSTIPSMNLSITACCRL